MVECKQTYMRPTLNTMSSESARIQVIVRVRPLSSSEQVSGQTSSFTFPTSDSCIVNNQRFSFDRVFQPAAKQNEIFNERFKEIVDHVLDGFNGSIIAYGQTAAGKSYTMSGGKEEESWGIIPRSIARIFANTNQPVQATFVELYNDRLQDLFSNKENVTMLGDGSMKNAQTVVSTSKAQLMDAIDRANNIRATASTKMNSQSSRSHAVLQLWLGSQHNHAKLVLVDLAGSEKVAKTGTTGTKLGEAGNINKSLTVLAMVIQALSSRSAHIPYRDSKLTQMLRDSIGGNSKTALIVNCSASVLHERESFSSLRFGSRAKLVENKVQSSDELEAIATTYSLQQDLKSEIQQWELHGNLARENWIDLARVRLPEQFVMPLVHDPYAELLNKNDLDNSELFKQEIDEQVRLISETETAIRTIDNEARELDLLTNDKHTCRSDATLELFAVQVKRLTSAIHRCREQNAALLKDLVSAKAMSPSEKSQAYLRRLDELCEHYSRSIANVTIDDTGKAPPAFKRRRHDIDTSTEGLKHRRAN